MTKKEIEKPLIYPLFSKVVYTLNTLPGEKEIQIILKEVKNKKFKNVSQASSMSEDIHVLDSKNLKSLKQMLEQEIKNYAISFLKYKDNFQITTSWFTNTGKDGYSEFHNHSNAMFSGCFYIKTNPETDKISFSNFNSPTWLLEPEEYNIYNCRQMNFDVYPGLLILFPAEMFHRVKLNVNSEERISLAFNVVPVGKFGHNDSSLNIIKCK
jgi:uncharacterized protein (TIGR02466 family)